MSMGMPASSIYMSHIICISPIDGNHINIKAKSHHPLPRKHHLSPENPMMFVGHTMSSCPHTSGGNLLTQKNPLIISTWPTPPKDIYALPSFDPHTLEKAQKHEKGLKNPLKEPKYLS